MALDEGVNFFDTARAYGDSEEMIGKAITDRREEYYIATKTGERDYEGAKKEIEISLNNLQTDYIDIYQLHNVATPEAWEAVMGDDGALKALIEARDEGKIGHIGITIHRSLENMKKAINEDIFETIMLYYNPIDEENIESEILPLAGKSETGVIAMKALSGGSLVMPKNIKKKKKLDKDPLVEGCIRFVINNPHVDVVIPGMRNVGELKENLDTETMPPLSAEEKKELIKTIGQKDGTYKYDQSCLQCGYCQPCPEEVEIPSIFRTVYAWKQYPESVKHEAVKIAAEIETGPEKCIVCGKCVEKCPAGIEIPERLQDVTDEFQEISSKI